MNPTHTPVPAAESDTPTVVVTPATILRGAARYLEIYGWTQGQYYGADKPFPPVCADGAIGMAAFGRTNAALPGEPKTAGYRDYSQALTYLVDYLDEIDAEPLHQMSWDEDGPVDCGPNPFLWNDDPGRTADEVIATLRAAADEYDWQHATEDDLETYADICAWREEHPTRDGFLAWLGAR